MPIGFKGDRARLAKSCAHEGAIPCEGHLTNSDFWTDKSPQEWRVVSSAMVSKALFGWEVTSMNPGRLFDFARRASDRPCCKIYFLLRSETALAT